MAGRQRLIGLYLGVVVLALFGVVGTAFADDVPTGHGEVTVTADRPEENGGGTSSNSDPGANPTDLNPSHGPGTTMDDPDPGSAVDPCKDEKDAYEALLADWYPVQVSYGREVERIRRDTILKSIENAKISRYDRQMDATYLLRDKQLKAAAGAIIDCQKRAGIIK